MIQVVLRAPGDIGFQQVPIPAPGPGDVLVRNHFCGICGTDVRRFSGAFSLFGGGPIHLGHEVSGIVEAVGDDVSDLKPGDSVVIDPNFSCGYCEPCRTGRPNHCRNMKTIGMAGPAGFSDYSLAPRKSVYAFDPVRLAVKSAVLSEPLACVLHGLDRLAPKPGRRALVVGAGTIGLLFLQTLRLYGVAEICVADIRSERLAVAERLGADRTILVEPGVGLGASLADDRHGFTYAIDCTGKSSVTQDAVSLLDEGGKLLVFGVCPEDEVISISPFELFRREIQLIGAFSLADKMASAVSILETGRIETEPLVDSIRDREELVSSIKWLQQGNGEGRVVVAVGGAGA